MGDATITFTFPPGFNPEESNIVQHARRELLLAGLLDEDSDYNGMVGRAVLELATVFASQGHSGGTAEMTLELLKLIVDREALTEITNDPDEWTDVSEQSGYPLWQSQRNSKAFSTDGGKTHSILEPGDTPLFEHVMITKNRE